jgi:hypothetical protein
VPFQIPSLPNSTAFVWNHDRASSTTCSTLISLLKNRLTNPLVGFCVVDYYVIPLPQATGPLQAFLRDARSDGSPSSHSPVIRSSCDAVGGFRGYGMVTPVGQCWRPYPLLHFGNGQGSFADGAFFDPISSCSEVSEGGASSTDTDTTKAGSDTSPVEYLIILTHPAIHQKG